MASSSKRSRTPHTKKLSVDRFSLLTDDVLHHVLSYVDFLDVVRTCVLSKRWRYVWTSTPYLNFNMDWYVKHNCDKKSDLMEQRYKFWDFIKWSLILRGDSQVIRITLHSDTTTTEQLNGLLRFAAKKKVQEIFFLDDYTSDELEFPRVLCETLTALTVSFRYTIPLRVTAILSNLRSLILTRVIISGDVAAKLLSSDCVKLEDVYLENCHVEKNLKEINVSACNLKNLTIANACSFKNIIFVGSFDTKLIICAPNLLSFCYIGPILRGLMLVNTKSLRNVTIRRLRVPYSYEDEHINYSVCPARIIGLNNAKALTFSTLVVKYFCPRYTDPPLCDTFILDNVALLDVELRYNFDQIEGLINLLKFSPNLEALIIRFKKGTKKRRLQKESRKAIEVRSFSKSRVEDVACLSYHVKTIQVYSLDGSAIAVELVKFLLQNGKVLEKMEIMYLSGERKWNSFSNLEAFPKASSRVVISFPGHAQRKNHWLDNGNSDTDYDD